MKEFAVVISIHLKPGYEEEFLRLVTPIIFAMRHEPTFINNVVHQDPEDSTHFMIYETWADQEEFFTVQFKREYCKAYEARLLEIIREPRQIKMWQPLRRDFTFFSGGLS